MNTKEALARMLSSSGRSGNELSLSLGKHRNFIASSLNRDPWNPTVETLVTIARACGYSVVLEGHGERVELDA